jgi:hypothetical protein
VARRELRRVGGFVHDISTVAALSDEPTNIRLLSDRSLYILQNLSQEDVTFLSRYGEILTGGWYLPVLAGSPEASDVEDAVDLIRRDLNSMGVEELLACICATNETLVEQGAVAGQAVGDIASDGTVSIGPNEQFPDQETYFDAKCNVSNAIFDTILGIVDWLDDNDVDLIAGLFGGVTSGLLVAVAFAGPVGWAWLVVGSIITGIAGYIVKLAVNFSDLSDALGDTHDECVAGLYNASNALAAKTSFVEAVEDGSPVITSVESGLLSLFLVSDLLNNLFLPRDDIVNYVSPDPVVCPSCNDALQAAEGTPPGIITPGSPAQTITGVLREGNYYVRLTSSGGLPMVEVQFSNLSGHTDASGDDFSIGSQPTLPADWDILVTDDWGVMSGQPWSGRHYILVSQTTFTVDVEITECP